MKKSLLFFFLIGLTTCVFAQNTFNGQVVDSQNLPLERVNIRIDGTTIGTTSDFDGRFSITTDIENPILEFSILGYKSQSISGARNSIVILIEAAETISEVVIVGSRNPRQTKLETPVAVDVVNVASTRLATAQTTANDFLSNILPSFNSIRQSSSDGTEHIDPASLRGLGPDQVLVLINGKRRHTTSLLNNQGTFGNGSVGTDLSSIPTSAIDRIEVLRDGAAAQYGSDAIAGVINIILKKNIGFQAVTTYGVTSEGDGETTNINLNYGLKIGDDGFINLSAELNDRAKTTRTQNHELVIYDQSKLGNFFAYPFSNDGAKERDDELITAAGLTRDDFNFQIGDADISNLQLFTNLEIPTSDHGQFYAAGGGNFRSGEGFGFRRLPSEGHTLEIFPNGFQPILESNVTDLSLIAGYKTQWREWNFDISNTIGHNQFDYTVAHTVNDALGPNGATSFDAGGHAFFQNTINVDFSRFNDHILNGLGIAYGAEFRLEKYNIHAGEEGSYIGDGAQSFPGFSPANEVDERRSSLAIYTDFEFNLTQQFLIGIAGRFENFSDFGSTLNGKLAARYKLTESFALRGAIGTGFRAPSLHQKYFNNIATVLVDGNLINGGTFRNDSEIANTLGITELKEETSQTLSLGLTGRISKNFELTLDAYQVHVNDRIVYTGSLGNDVFGDPIEGLQSILKPLGVSSARFFTNAVNTSTKGIDLVLNYRAPLNQGYLNISLLYNRNQTEVDQTLNDLPAIFEGQEDVYFGSQERSLIETNIPQDKSIFTIDRVGGRLSFTLRNTLWGKVTRDGFPFGDVQEHSSKITTDISTSYQLSDHISVIIGANNLFNAFPDKQIFDNSYFGVFKYAPVQMGTTGTFYFARLSYQL